MNELANSFLEVPTANPEALQAARYAKLSDKQKAFIREYLIDYNGSCAAQRAGYSKGHSGVQANKNLKNPTIALCIRHELDKQAKRNNLNAESVLKQIMTIAYNDFGELFGKNGKVKAIKDIPEHIRCIIQEYKVTHDRDGNENITVKIPDKLKALEMLGRHLTLFKEVIEHKADDKLLKLMRQARKRVERHGYIIRDKEIVQDAEVVEIDDNQAQIPADMSDNT